MVSFDARSAAEIVGADINLKARSVCTVAEEDEGHSFVWHPTMAVAEQLMADAKHAEPKAAKDPQEEAFTNIAKKQKLTVEDIRNGSHVANLLIVRPEV